MRGEEALTIIAFIIGFGLAWSLLKVRALIFLN
jgi:hypothetical protein